MKILLLGDASNFNCALAPALRRRGHTVVLASEGSGFMQTPRDIDTGRRPGKLGGLRLYLSARAGSMWRALRGFDVVAVHNPVFMQLRPERLRPILDGLCRRNGRLFLTALGTDTPYMEECLDPASRLLYNEWRLPSGPSPLALERPDIPRAWLDDGPLRRYTDYFYSRISGAVSALYEYDLALARRLPRDRYRYGGIPVDMDAVAAGHSLDPDAPVVLFLGRHRHRMTEKGTLLLESAARAVAARHPDLCRLEVVENRPYAEYVQLLQRADVVLDQVYSYTPATNALLAMAMGKVAVSGGEEDYYRFIGEPELRPVVNVQPDPADIEARLEALVTDRADMRARMAAGRTFVERHNSADVVAGRFLDCWMSDD